MLKNKVFWNAFLDGLAAPWSFWAPRPDYRRFVLQSSVEDTFAQVGANLSSAMDGAYHERASNTDPAYAAAE